MGGLLPLLDVTWAHNLPSAFSAAFPSCNWSSTAPSLLPHSKSTLRGVTRCCTQTRLPPACRSWTSSQSEEGERDSLDFTKSSVLLLPQAYPLVPFVSLRLWGVFWTFHIFYKDSICKLDRAVKSTIPCINTNASPGRACWGQPTCWSGYTPQSALGVEGGESRCWPGPPMPGTQICECGCTPRTLCSRPWTWQNTHPEFCSSTASVT